MKLMTVTLALTVAAAAGLALATTSASARHKDGHKMERQQSAGTVTIPGCRNIAYSRTDDVPRDRCGKPLDLVKSKPRGARRACKDPAVCSQGPLLILQED